MKTYLTTILLAFLLPYSFLGCKKDDMTVVEPTVDSIPQIDIQLPDLTTKINSTVSGFVTDENNNAVANANVSAGNITAITDEYGFFKIANAQVVKTAAVVTVTKPGYFNCIKTYIAGNNKAAFFRMKLIPKTIAGSINAASGGSVALTNGMTVSLQPNSVTNTLTGTNYSGVVKVAAYWINPTSAELHKIMPGDLRGIDTAGTLKLLKTFGMAAVELSGAAGEPLQITNGKKATLTMPIPISILTSAPATIPLWHFDETKGLWKEEGKATKSGNKYVGEVSHFSFWNCDAPFEYVPFSCSIKDPNGNPVKDMLVKVSYVSDPSVSAFGYTDSSGYTSGGVPANAQLLLEVFGASACSAPLYSSTFTTGSTEISLGNITVPGSGLATVSGSVQNCNGNAVTNGFIIMNRDNLNYRYELTNGVFNFQTTYCGGNNSITLIAEDISSGQQSSLFTHNLVSGINNIGVLNACGTSTQEFINYTLSGVAYSFTPPSIFYMTPGGSTTNSAFISAGTLSRYVTIHMILDSIAVGSNQFLLGFHDTQTNPVTYQFDPVVYVQITEYGAVGQFISGNFSAAASAVNPAINMSFRVRRAF